MTGIFLKSSKYIYKIEYTTDQNIKRYEVRFVVFINRESWLWKYTALGARHTSSVVDSTLDNWCDQSRRTYQTTYMVWDSGICTSSVWTHGIAHTITWETWGSTRVMEIPNFTTRLNIESYKGQEKNCNKVRDEGSWYLWHRWIQRRLTTEETTCHPNFLIQMQREDGAPPKREWLR